MSDNTLARLTRFRRDLHRIPELDRELPQTLAYVKNELGALPCRVFSPADGALCAFFDCGKEDTVAFRSDMDALPVEEHTGLPFASTHAGCMHACGHDGHMALLLALAHLIAELAPALPHNVLLIFQPAEETTGGAQDICASGVFEAYHVRHIFGTHLWPALPAGAVVTRPGPMLAQSNALTVTVTGKSSHVARAWEGKDALLAGVELVHRGYRMVDEELPADEPRLLRFGMMESGTVNNAISAHTLLKGGIRSFRPETFRFIRDRLFAIADGIAEETGCRFDFAVGDGYPPVVNDEALYAKVKACLGDGLGLADTFMIAEDFAFYGQRVPAVFFLLGTGTDEPLHSDRFDFDESVLLSGLETYRRLLYL